MSQDELAKLMGKSHRTVVSSWEKSKSEPSLSDIRKLAQILDTTVAYLVDGVETDTVKTELVPKSELDELKLELFETQRELLKLQRQKLEEKTKQLEQSEKELEKQKRP